MRRILMLVVTAVVLGWAPQALKASHGAKHELRALKKRHKEQKKTQKQQEHAMKMVMNQHEQSMDESERFKHDLKMQRQLLRRDQRDETHNLKERDKLVRQPHPSS